MATGNRSVLVIIDSRRTAARQTADLAVFAALDHMGAAWQTLDAADYWTVPASTVRERAAYILAHDGAGGGMRPEHAAQVAAAVTAGAGLISLDRDLDAWPAALQVLRPSTQGTVSINGVAFPNEGHFITAGHRQGAGVMLRGSTSSCRFRGGDGLEALACGDAGEPVLVAGRHGAGRSVFFGMGNTLYDEAVLGHTRGLDGLFWRSVVWAAAKPFPLRCIPPFVSARMDDCNGTYSAFGYVDVLNRHGISPNLGLFLDELGPTDWAAAARLQRSGGADFSMHAFRDDGYKAKPSSWRPHAVLADKPDLSNGGRETRFEGFGLNHDTGRDLDSATFADNARRVDAAFARAGIRQSRVLNAHFGEVGLRSLPYFLARGIDLPCNNSVIGQLYGNQPVWRPRPYCLRADNGRHGLVIDRLPQHPAFVSVGFSASHLGRTHMNTDILHGHTPFAGESDRVRIPEAVTRGVHNVRTGLDSLAFGVIFTHEQRIHCIALEAWETIVTGILSQITDFDTLPASREHVSVICRRLFETRLSYAQAGPGSLACEITGESDGPSPLTVWRNDGDSCRSERVEVAAVEGFLAVTVR